MCAASPHNLTLNPLKKEARDDARSITGADPSCPHAFRLPVDLALSVGYHRTLMFFLAQISFRISGQTLTVTSPRWAFLSRSIMVRD
jgi:hypothetical protein